MVVDARFCTLRLWGGGVKKADLSAVTLFVSFSWFWLRKGAEPHQRGEEAGLLWCSHSEMVKRTNRGVWRGLIP